jgi:hypothetical protein
MEFKATQKQLDIIKKKIMQGEKLDDYGNYKCGCAINPRFHLINKMCSKHQSEIEKQ